MQKQIADGVLMLPAPAPDLLRRQLRHANLDAPAALLQIGDGDSQKLIFQRRVFQRRVFKRYVFNRHGPPPLLRQPDPAARLRTPARAAFVPHPRAPLAAPRPTIATRGVRQFSLPERPTPRSLPPAPLGTPAGTRPGHALLTTPAAESVRLR